MKRLSNPGRSWPLRPMLGFVIVALVLVAGAIGWARSRSGAPASVRPASEPPLTSAPINDTAAETWRVLPPPAPPPAAPGTPPAPAKSPATVKSPAPDWSALSAGMVDEPTGAAISLGAPAELESGLSASERERLIASDLDQRIRPERSGRGKGTVVVGRGTPRGGGRGRCD